MAASNATIGALRVVLGADTIAFDKGLKDAEKTLARFQANMVKIGAALGTGIAAAAVGLGVAIKKAVDEADKLGKMGQSFGIPVEQLSALKHAADLSGVSIEEVGKSVGRLSRSMSEIAGGATNSAANAFKALGISVTDSNGQLKTSTQVMEEVADKFAGLQDGAGKTALAISIFGRSGANLIPLLNQGAKGLQEAREEAEALGLVIDTRTSRAAEAFNDNLTRLERVMNGVALRLAAELAPALAVTTEELVKFVKEGNLVRTISETMISGFLGIYVAGQQLSVTFNRIGAEASALWKVLLAPNFTALSTAWDEFKNVVRETDQQFAAIRENADNVRSRITQLGEAFSTGASGAQKFTAPVIAGKNAIDEFIKSQQKAIATQQAEAAAVGLSAGARERLRVIMQAEAIAQQNHITLTEAQRVKLTELANAAQTAALQMEGRTLIEQALPAWQQYQMQVENANLALQAVGATSVQVAQVQTMLAQRAGLAWEQMATSTISGFKDLFTQLGKQGATWAAFAKGLAIVEATINTYTAFTKALASAPPPFNYALAAATLAAGLAKVMAIKSQTIPKMATGGALTPNAFPGQDSVLMQARVRPDEQIDIWRPGEGPDPRRGGRGGGAQSITVLISDRTVREFWASGIAQINSLTNDGYRLNVAQA